MLICLVFCLGSVGISEIVARHEMGVSAAVINKKTET
jgi:hypothetical protein